jgi:hypothetical protein
MSPRLAAVTVLCRELAIPALVLAWIGAFGPAGIDYTAAAPVRTAVAPVAVRHANSPANSLYAEAKPADADAKPAANFRSDADAKPVAEAKSAAEAKPVTEIKPVAETKSADQLPIMSTAADEVAVTRSMAEAPAATPPPALRQPEPTTEAKAAVTEAIADAKPDADAKPADNPPITLATADAAPVTRSMAEAPAADPKPASQEPEPVVTAALTDSAETLPSETPPAAKPAAELPADCAAVDSCIDHYLWTLYERTPKEDTVKSSEQRKVSVKKRGRMVTVTRTVTTTADEDFGWKDPKAADHVNMTVAEYVIGGMDREFKLKLFNLLRAADEAGLSPGITSAFRDDYRQSIASGLKAANDRSYHGGSSRGGYGHGLAADIVSVNGETRAQRLNSSQTLWAWVDAHGKDYGIGRPYLSRDPPHVAPTDGQEYASHRPGIKARLAAAAARLVNRVAAAARRARTAARSD